jgi:hypothetical protein
MSIWVSFREMGSLPTACTASVWKIAPLALASLAISSTGKTTPVSLLAHMTLTMAVSSRMASAAWLKSRLPWRSTGRKVTSKPRPARFWQKLSTAGCSTRVVTMWRLLGKQRRALMRAVLSLSVPQEVKMISSGEAPSRSATWARAWSM